MVTKPNHTRARSAGTSHLGKLRENNEDVLLIEPGIGLYAVLDGMGGAKAGEVAAQLACTTIAEYVRAGSSDTNVKARELLALALDEASAAVFTAAGDNPRYRGMGTTAVALLEVNATGFVIGHVGDSRAYRVRGGLLQLLTRDHTIAQTLVETGEMTTEEADRSRLRDILTRNLGNTLGVRATMREERIEPGDRILLCSDGLYNEVTAERICNILESHETPDKVAQKLIDMTLEGEARDNVSVVVIDWR